MKTPWLDFVSIKFCFHSKIANRIAKSIGTANVEQLFQIEQLVQHDAATRSKCQFYLIASTRRLRAPPNSCSCLKCLIWSTRLGIAAQIFYMAPSRQWPTVDGINKCSFFIYKEKIKLNIQRKDLRQFTRVSNRDESNCSNGGESECPPIVDKSTIECPQIESLCIWLVYLRLRLPECYPNWRV